MTMVHWLSQCCIVESTMTVIVESTMTEVHWLSQHFIVESTMTVVYWLSKCCIVETTMNNDSGVNNDSGALAESILYSGVNNEQ